MYTQGQFEVNQQLSLYIPHVFLNFTSEYITGVFEFMEFGEVERVDLVSKIDKNGKVYNAAYIHFSEWFVGPIAANFQARVLDPNREARIIHDDPWYWIVLENTAKKHVPGARKECVDLSEPQKIAPGLENILPNECGLAGPVLRTPTAGVFQVVLTEKEKFNIDTFLEELQKSDVEHVTDDNNDDSDDGSDYTDEYSDCTDQIYRENEELRTANTTHVAHANECHEMIAALRRENNALYEQINLQTEDIIDLEMHLDETNKRFDYAVQCLDKSEEELMDLELEIQNEMVYKSSMKKLLNQIVSNA